MIDIVLSAGSCGSKTLGAELRRAQVIGCDRCRVVWGGVV